MGFWWQVVRKKDPTAPPSATLRLLDAWFVRGDLT